MGQRSVLVVAGWLGAVVLAVLVGLGAIKLIGSGLTSSEAAPRSEAQVARDLAALPPSAAVSLGSRPTPTPSPTPGEVSRSFNTRGGVVVARCVAGGAEITNMSPEPGFAMHERTVGAQPEAEGEFRSNSDNHDRVKFSVTCAGGKPSFAARGND